VEGEQVDKIDLENHAVWYQTNPAMGIRLSEEFAAEECRSMSADGFARERLGWWSPVLTEQSDKALDARAWAACASEAEKPEGKTAYGVKFAADGSAVCLCGAVIPKDGPARVSLIEQQPTRRGLAGRGC